MSQERIAHSPDIRRLIEAGFQVEIREVCLLVHAIPYLTQEGQIEHGSLVSKLELAGDHTVVPTDHVAYFIGSHPYQSDGKILGAIQHTSNETELAPGIRVNHSFSNKPPGGYLDYYHKMTRYIEIICNQARSRDPSATAKTYRSMITADFESPFHYCDTATVKAGTTQASAKLKGKKVGIIGLGGTGSYILDLIAKTPVSEIHIFDGDVFLQHNAFRAPGAPNANDIAKLNLKVDYLGDVYDRMRSGIVRHPVFLRDENRDELPALDFAFVCVDNAAARKTVLNILIKSKTPFVDVGMGLNLNEDTGEITGACRTTLVTPTKRDHLEQRVPISGEDPEGAYAANIQIAELNALNAAQAVIRWKRFVGYYHDGRGEHNSIFVVELNQLSSQEEADEA